MELLQNMHIFMVIWIAWSTQSTWSNIAFNLKVGLSFVLPKHSTHAFPWYPELHAQVYEPAGVLVQVESSAHESVSSVHSSISAKWKEKFEYEIGNKSPQALTL